MTAELTGLPPGPRPANAVTRFPLSRSHAAGAGGR
jgi:hypothetical protein